MPVVSEWGMLRAMTRAVFLSCLLHLGLAGGFALMPPWVGTGRPPILPVELVTLDAPVEPPPDPPRRPPPRQRIQPPRLAERPRLIEPSRPAEHTRAVEEPPPATTPLPVLEEPAPPMQPSSAPPAPRVDAGPKQTAAPVTSEPAPAAGPVVTVAPGAGNGLPAAAAPSVAALPRREAPAATDGVTRVARPQGGYQVRPTYPSAPRQLGIQGTTLLRVHILADGRIGDVVVEKSAGHIELDRSAAEAVRQWRFEPARRGTEPVATWVLLPVEFRLQ